MSMSVRRLGRRRLRNVLVIVNGLGLDGLSFDATTVAVLHVATPGAVDIVQFKVGAVEKRF